MEGSRILLLEPFCGGSHKQLIELFMSKFQSDLYTLPGKKWHWRARVSALYFSQVVPQKESYRSEIQYWNVTEHVEDQTKRVLFASSVINLAELVALRPDLNRLKKILYFHENQLIYPVRKQQDRDFQYGYNQIISCLVADKVVFNSKYNMESFLSSINSFLKLIPDNRPKGIPELIRPKCSVVNFPMSYPDLHDNDKVSENELKNAISNKVAVKNTSSKKLKLTCTQGEVEPKFYVTNTKCVTPVSDLQESQTCKANVVSSNESDFEKEDSKPERRAGAALNVYGPDDKKPLHIVWPHRWEHDKGPNDFFSVMFNLLEAGLDFRLSVLGEQFTDVPDIFDEAQTRLGSKILYWGYQSSKSEYFEILQQADCVVSTALHEFFGVAMLEAVYCGCYPLCPDRLVYPEIFPKTYLYNTDNQLYKTLRDFCKRPWVCRNHKTQIDVNKYSWDNLKSEFKKLLDVEQEEKHLQSDINISKETEHTDIDRQDTITQAKT